MVLDGKCALCGADLDGSGHAICPACRGMAPSDVAVASGGPLFGQALAADLSAAPVPLLTDAARLFETPAPTLEPLPTSLAERRTAPDVRIFPDIFISGLSTIFLIMCVISVLTIFAPAGLGLKANPNLMPADARPGWYLLFYSAFLHYVPTIIGIFAPLAAIVGLIALPFLDRNPERAPARRIMAIAWCILVVLGIAGLAFIGYMK